MVLCLDDHNIPIMKRIISMINISIMIYSTNSIEV
jgi:hypothetical protein